MTEPWATMAAWLAEAERTEPSDPTAMQLATVGADGRPSVRTVLVRGVDPRGLCFFTNYGSRKALQMDGQPYVAGVVHHKSLARQIHVEGRVERLSAAESDAYFATRPRESQIGAWASRQSDDLPARDVLDEAVRVQTARFEGQRVPRPPFWGGWRIVPDRIELWQGRPSRLHDRTVWWLRDGAWASRRLYP